MEKKKGEKMKKILITGITGFVGSHLADFYLKQDNVDLWGIKKWRSDLDNIKHIENKIKWKECDITDTHSVESVVKEIRPDIIHHLAAMSYVPSSWLYPQRTVEINVIGSLNFFEAIRKYVPDCIIQIASSSEVYGIPTELPINEKMLPNPCSPYGVSKLAMDRFASQYYQSFGVKIVITRGFNHTGPRRGSEFVCSTFAKQIAEIEIEKKMKEPIIKVGNLQAKRDFTDVRDMVKAYVVSVDKCKFGEPYNIASGISWKIEIILQMLISYSPAYIIIEQDPNRMRPSDLHTLSGDASKFWKETGWIPEIPFEQTLLDLLNFWRKKIS